MRPGSQVFTSQSCFSCHDGSVASDAQVTFPITIGGTGSASLDTSLGHVDAVHPVDVNYAAARQRRPGWLRPMDQLPPEVMLPQGLVTCTSCHSSRSRQAKKVALSLERSALCLACHSL